MRACHFPLLVPAAIAMASGTTVLGQVPYPPHVVQDVSWSNGAHHTAVTNKILSPGAASQPVSISGTADAEFVSATEVRLTDGFHAGGFTGSGRFRARIDESLGEHADLVVISPKPATHAIDNVLHVEKWEKLEIGLKLPQDYQDAIDRFFDHYFSNGTNQPVTPDSVDTARDLNPYADDSLQLVMTLIDPSGDSLMKWGFFMREARWFPDIPLGKLAEQDGSHSLYPYHIRFRFAPDEEGPWQFSLSIKAPYTSIPANDPLPDLLHTGYQLICEPPLPDNNGYLQVNENNQRVLQFEGDKNITGDETSFFGLGTNMADVRRLVGVGTWYAYHQRDFDVMLETMGQLNAVGGNFLRMYLMRHLFAPEWVNLGVYDAYHAPEPCDDGSGITYDSNCQWQCWAFDRMLDTARANGIYIQACLDPYPPITNYETYIWGVHPYMTHFLEPERDTLTQLLDMKRFFYANGDTANTDSGVFYYWKRKYKYMMARWGYSVNIAALEPFNETDQMLSYQSVDLTDEGGVCPENQLIWPADTALPGIVDSWLTDIIDYVRDPVDLTDPVGSPLGESHRLFLMSYTDAQPAGTTVTDYFLPFENERVDLIDVHKGIWPNITQENTPDGALEGAFDHAADFRNAYPYSGAPESERKPFSHGEFNHYFDMAFGPPPNNIHSVVHCFHNYDLAFHNELWSSAFSGTFAAGTSWLWERVFWWPDAMKRPPSDPDNNIWQVGLFSNAPGGVNRLDIGLGFAVLDTNKTVHHHFEPLANLLEHPSWMAYDFFNGYYTANKAFSSGGEIESYYLKDSSNTVAIGWVHNRNAWLMNSYYLANTDTTENLLGCTVPGDASITLTGFLDTTQYHITWFPTRMNGSVLPLDTVWLSSSTGTLLLDLSTAPFGDTVAFFADTLRADYAFIITLDPFAKSLMLAQNAESLPGDGGWDFALYPNPTRDAIYLLFTDDRPKDIIVLDVTGRRLLQQSSVTAPMHQLPIDQGARGAYWVRVSDGANWKVKKLIVH